MNTLHHKRLKGIFFSLFAKRVLLLGPCEIRLYCQQAGQWVLERREEHPRAAQGDFPKHAVMVVGRELYFEMNHLFPITSTKDLVKAVGLQAPGLAPREYCRHAFSFSRHEKGSLVTLWFFNPELQAWIDSVRPVAVFPEDALPHLRSGKDAPELFYAKRWGDWLISFRKERGDIISRLIPDTVGEEEAVLSFRRFAGHDATKAEEAFLGSDSEKGATGSDYFATLAGIVHDIPLKQWPRFLCRERLKAQTVGRPLLYFQAIVLLFFFFLPPTFSFMHARSVHEELSLEEKALKKKVGRYLNVRDEADKKLALIEKLSAPLREYVPRTLVLSELGRWLHSEDDILQSIQVIGLRMEIRGETRSSSDLLGRLGKSEYFSDARLSSPVIKDLKSDKERFVIEVTLVPLETGD